jgi:putative SOS response-associated peptidase YedK
VCGRYTLATPAPGEVRARFGLSESVEIPRRYNIAPADDVLAVTLDREGRRRPEMLRWGLVPPWSQGPGSTPPMINARVETVQEKPAFRTAFERFRCLIIADGFYEWQRAASGAKQAFHITRDDGSPFAFAGLWSVWHAPDGRSLRSCTILTTAANEALAPLHDRMPVILEPELEVLWLETTSPAHRLHDAVAAVAPDRIALRRVGPAVNDARYDGPDCLAGPEPERQTALF